MSLLDQAVRHLQEMFPQHSAVSLVHLLERLHFDFGAAAEQLLSTPDSSSSRSPFAFVTHLPINGRGALSVSPKLEIVDTSDHLQVTDNTATSAPYSAALQQSLQSVPQQHTQAQSSLGLLWSEPACRVAHVPLIHPLPTPTPPPSPPPPSSLLLGPNKLAVLMSSPALQQNHPSPKIPWPFLTTLAESLSVVQKHQPHHQKPSSSKANPHLLQQHQ